MQRFCPRIVRVSLLLLVLIATVTCDYFPDRFLLSDARVSDASVIDGVAGEGPTIDGSLDGPAPDKSSSCGYLYRRSITIAAKQVGLDNVGALPATGFPVLVQLSGGWLKTTTVDPAKGRITSASGDDIVFRSSSGTTGLDHEIERYDGTAGTLVAWVRVNSLSKASATTIYLHYGNPCVTASTQNAAAVWDANYKGVWHLNEEAAGVGTKDVYRDSSGNTNHGADQTSATGQAGQIAAGQQFDGVDDVVDLGADASLDIKQKLTLSAWIRVPNRPAKGKWYTVVAKEKWKYMLYLYGTSATKTHLGGWFELDTGNVDIFNKGGLDIDVAPNTWTQVAIAFDGKQFRLYVNGSLDYLQSTSGVIKGSPKGKLVLGLKESLYFKGAMDEVRVSDTARDGDWIVTSYNNQKNPGSYGAPGFYAVGGEGPGTP